MVTKNVIIIGDSYSTFEGYIPEGYAVYYTKKGERMPDVTSVDKTWWWMLSNELSLNIVENNSWSGSTVSYTGRAGDCSKTSSFIYRAECLIENGVFEKNNVDTVFIFGATNDSWIDVPLGELKYDDMTREDLFSVIPAISRLVALLTQSLPNVKVMYILNTDLKPEINEAVRAVCEHYGADLIELHDIEKCSGHPNSHGMEQIKDQVKQYLLK